jgi:hypothetical protein
MFSKSITIVCLCALFVLLSVRVHFAGQSEYPNGAALFSNREATGNLTLVLPPCVAGREVVYFNVTGDAFAVTSRTRILTFGFAANSFISGDTGASLQLRCDGAEWLAVSSVGWSVY